MKYLFWAQIHRTTVRSGMMVGWINIFPMGPATGQISDWTSPPSYQCVRQAHLALVFRCVQTVDAQYRNTAKALNSFCPVRMGCQWKHFDKSRCNWLEYAIGSGGESDGDEWACGRFTNMAILLTFGVSLYTKVFMKIPKLMRIKL